jgi:hypothetical protein
MTESALNLEVVKHLEEQAVRAAGCEGVVEFRRVPELGENKVAQIRQDGTVAILEKETRRNHQLGNVESVRDWVEYSATAEPEDANIVVWASENELVIVLDDSSEVRPHNGGYCRMPYSPEFELVKGWAEKPNPLEQKAFVRLLRSQIGHCLMDTQDGALVLNAAPQFDIKAELIETFSTLRFESKTQSGGRITARSEFLGREESADISSGTADAPRDIPPVIDLFVRPYRDPAMQVRYRIPCEVVIDHENCRISLQPSLTDVQVVQDKATAAVLETVMAALPDTVAGFLGRP